MFKLHEHIYSKINEYLTTNSLYKDNIYVLKNNNGVGTIENDEVIVFVYYSNYSNTEQTLNYNHRLNTYSFLIDILSKGVGRVGGEQVVQTVTDEIVDFIQTDLHFEINRVSRTPNLDVKVYRYQINISGLFDEMNKVIYPNS